MRKMFRGPAPPPTPLAPPLHVPSLLPLLSATACAGQRQWPAIPCKHGVVERRAATRGGVLRQMAVQRVRVVSVAVA
jgi:hypothetical protein